MTTHYPYKNLGHANHGWLDARHHFSFANYHNSERQQFGVLRVINDDVIKVGAGFDTHPHKNMEIITYVKKGAITHRDSNGNVGRTIAGDVQVMSAGTGVHHSEYNKNTDRDVNFLQIWVVPNKEGVTPRYDQIKVEPEKIKNKLHQILSPNTDDEGVWIHQNAWFHLGDLDKGKEFEYKIKNKSNGVYAFVLEGDIILNGQELNPRDGFGVWDTDTLQIKTKSPSRVLLMEVPMT